MTIPQAVRSIRPRQKLTQAEFASRLGTTQSNASRYERGAIVPGYGALMALHNMASTDEERAPIREALGFDPGWPDEWKVAGRDLEATAAAEADLAAKPIREVIDNPLAAGVIVRVMRLWMLNQADPTFAQALRSALGYLEVAAATAPDYEALPAPQILRNESKRDAFVRVMETFVDCAPPEEIEMLERHARAVIKIQEKTRPRSNEKAG